MKALLLISLLLTAVLLLASFAWAQALPPNELGRVMVLQYHRIDQPEERWTRTPENLRRDLVVRPLADDRDRNGRSGEAKAQNERR